MSFIFMETITIPTILVIFEFLCACAFICNYYNDIKKYEKKYAIMEENSQKDKINIDFLKVIIKMLQEKDSQKELYFFKDIEEKYYIFIIKKYI